MATVLVVSASTPILSPEQENANETYIIGFNENVSMSNIMDDQMAAFISDNNGKVLYRYDMINAIAVEVPKDVAGKLSSLNNVKYVEKEITFHATLDDAAPIIGAPEVWDNLSYTGKGVKVALIDSGIDGSHPDLKDKIVEWKDFVTGKSTPYDDFGHGSHCAGIIAGTGTASNGKYRGIAPDAQLIGIKVLGQGGYGSESNILAGIEYAANTDAQVISMSLGSEQHSQAIHDAVSKAVAKGKIVVVAAGNSGPGSGTIGCPSDNRDVITVGATDKSDNIASFSSRGPTKDGLIKPDVVAPGKDIVSVRATGIKEEKAIDKYYMSMSGTSMACPMVSGTVALMLQADPTLTPQKAKEILQKTAKPLCSKIPGNDYGYGRISAKNAIDYIKTGNFTPWPTPSPTPAPSPTPTPTPTPSPGYPDPGQPNPGYPGFPYPGYPYPGYPSPGYPYPGYPYPGYPSPGYPSPGYPYPGQPNPGYPYPGMPGYNPGQPYPGQPYPGYARN